MTKEKIIEKIEEYSVKHRSCDPKIEYEWWEMSNTDKAGFADELLSMLEQEKKETVREICEFAEKQIKLLSKEKTTDSFGERPLLFFEAGGMLIKRIKEQYVVEL